MSIKFQCPTCEKKLSVQEDLAGKRARCPECGTVLDVPEPVLDAEGRIAPVQPTEIASPAAAPRPTKKPAEDRYPCPACGEMILVNARKCRFCGEIFDATLRKDIGDDPAMRLLLPVGLSGWAIASGYLGLISVLLVPAPFALLTGILAFREMRRNPRKHGMGRAIFGTIMGGLGTAALVLVLIAAAVGAFQRK